MARKTPEQAAANAARALNDPQWVAENTTTPYFVTVWNMDTDETSAPIAWFVNRHEAQCYVAIDPLGLKATRATSKHLAGLQRSVYQIDSVDPARYGLKGR